MVRGGKNYQAEVAQVIRLIQVLLAPLLVGYAGLVTLGIASGTTHAHPYLLVALAALWLLVSLYYFMVKAPTQADEALRLTVVHVLALSIFVFVIGFTTPFAALYVLLPVNAYMLFGRKGFSLSLLAFVLALLAHESLYGILAPMVLSQSGGALITVLFLALSVIGIMRAQETRRQANAHGQERARLQYDRMLTIINNLSDATFSTNEKGAVLMYNAACLDLLDTNDSLRGKNIADLFTLTDTDGQPVNLLTIFQEATRTTRRDDLNFIYSDGEQIRLEITFSPIRSSYSLSKKGQEQGGYIMIARDVTKQKSLEEQRDEFISTVSHELRTPITIVEGTLSNLDVMMKNPAYADPKKLSGTVTTAHEQVLYLARMVNDLSTLSRAERGVGDEAESIDVAELLHAMHRQYESEAQKKKLLLNIELGGRLGAVHASRLYLEELLQNFITNGIKYTKEGTVTIIAKRTKGVVTFAVSDTGIGISRGDQQKVFDKFYRSEDYRTREANGTGLGLYVAAKLARKLQTEIQLKSRLNHGSTFSFELPVTK